MRPVNLRAARRHQAQLRLPPRRATRRSAPALMAATLALLTLATPWLLPAAEMFASRAQATLGLVVEEVRIDGARRLDEAAIRTALAIEPGTAMLGLDLDAARNRLEDLAWVDHAVIRRLLTGTLEIHLTEHQALALWLAPDGVALLSENGETVPVAQHEVPRDLPLVTGAGAAAAAEEVAQILVLADRLDLSLDRLERLGERRWRLVLDSQQRVELPAEDVDRALRRLERFLAKEELLERAVAVVDLRLDDRIVVSPLPLLRQEAQG